MARWGRLAVLLLLPNVPHVDDISGVEEKGAVDSARDCFVELVDLLGFRLQQGKAAPPSDQRGGAVSLVALEGLVDFTTVATERASGLVCWVDMPHKKTSKYQRQIVHTLRDKTQHFED